MKRRDFTTITTNLLLGVKDLAEWGIDGGHTTAEKLRLTVSARQDTAKKLIADGMSRRKAAKLLGVSEKQIRRDMRPKAAKSADKGRADKNHPINPVDRCAMRVRSIVLEFAKEIKSDEQEKLFVTLRDEIDDCERTISRR